MLRWVPLSVVVHDLYFKGIAALPLKADAPLVIDTDAELPGAISSKGLEPVPGNQPEIF
jgi:hypothetical protein